MYGVGYEVEFLPAIRALEAAGRTAAVQWWTKHVPHLLHPAGRSFFRPLRASSWQKKPMPERADVSGPEEKQQVPDFSVDRLLGMT